MSGQIETKRDFTADVAVRNSDQQLANCMEIFIFAFCCSSRVLESSLTLWTLFNHIDSDYFKNIIEEKFFLRSEETMSQSEGQKCGENESG